MIRHTHYKNINSFRMKKILLLAVMLLAFSGTDCYAQGWLNKLNNALDATNRALQNTNDALDAFSGSSSSKGSTSTTVSDTPTRTERVESTGDIFKISTGYPDLKVKVKRCIASERTLIIDLLIENVSDDDVNSFELWGTRSMAIDDEGNEYKSLGVLLGDNNFSFSSGSKLFAQTPVKARIKIEGLSQWATMLRVLQISYECNKWGNNSRAIKIKNLPITRDDE